MVIDTSAIVAIAFNEPEAESFEHRIADAPICLTQEPLLFKGDHFSRTDIEAA